MFNNDKHICALVKDTCPETDDMSKSRFCPFWKVGIPDIERDGSGRLVSTSLYTGCSVYMILPYIVAGIAEADHAHAASNEARDECKKIAEPTRRLNGLFESLVQITNIQLTPKQIPHYEDLTTTKELTE